jgi:hypothetical protein
MISRPEWLGRGHEVKVLLHCIESSVMRQPDVPRRQRADEFIRELVSAWRKSFNESGIA